MKKMIAIAAMLGLSVGLFAIYEYLVHPPLPMETISPQEASQKITNSAAPIVYLTEEESVLWYAVKEKRADLANKRIQEYMESNGWMLTDTIENGLLFSRDAQQIKLTTHKWTKHYMLVKVPKEGSAEEIS